jgi:hypothetical protein
MLTELGHSQPLLVVLVLAVSTKGPKMLHRLTCWRENCHLDAPNAHRTWPPTTMHVDANQQHYSTCITHQQILPKALKAMDMRFHWLRYRNAQGQFCYYWRPSTQNLADYFTKHHLTSHHKSVHPTILTSFNDPDYTKLFKKPTTAEKFKPQIKKLVAT